MAIYKSIPQLVETSSPGYTDSLIIHGSGLTKKVQLQNIFPSVSSTQTINLELDKPTKKLTANIKPGSVGNTLLSAMNAFTIKGRAEPTQGTPQDLTVSEVQDLLSITELSATVQTVQSNIINKFTTNIGDGSLSAFDVIHNLNTRDIITQIYNNTNFLNVSASAIQNLDTNTVSLSFDFIPLNDELRVVVIG